MPFYFLASSSVLMKADNIWTNIFPFPMTPIANKKKYLKKFRRRWILSQSPILVVAALSNNLNLPGAAEKFSMRPVMFSTLHQS